MVDIAVTPRDDEAEPVNLGTSSYVFTFPKVSPLLSAQQKAGHVQGDAEKAQIAMDSQDAWLALGFGPEQWAHIQNRLDSNDDPLDFPHMQDLFKQLFEKAVQNRPPTWRGDSSRVSPQAFHGAAKPNPFVSTPTPSLSDASAT